MSSAKNSITKILRILLVAILFVFLVVALVFGRDALWLYNLKYGYEDFQKGDLVQAESKFKSAVSLARGFPEKDARLMITLKAFAPLYLAQARYSEAEPLITESVAIAEKVYGKDSCEAGSALGIYGGFYRRQGHYEQAIPIFNRALAIFEKCDRDMTRLPEMLSAIGKMNIYLGHPQQSKALYQRAYDLLVKKDGKDSPELAAVFDGFGLIDEWSGSYKSAEARYRDALNVKKTEHNAIERGAIMTNLADLMLAQGKLEQALDLANQALTTVDARPGMNMFFAADAGAQSCIAQIRIDRADLKGANDILAQALKTDKERLGPDHPNLAKVLRVSAQVQGKSGALDNAIATEKQAINIYEKSLGHKHRWTAQSLGELASLYFENGDIAAAEEKYKEAMDLEGQVMPPGHPDLAVMLRAYARLKEAAGKAGEAKSMRAQADEIMTQAASK